VYCVFMTYTCVWRFALTGGQLLAVGILCGCLVMGVIDEMWGNKEYDVLFC
jgi:hypothetical protein